MIDETKVYAARFPGMPGFGALCVDKPEYAKSTAKDIAKWIRRGASIERVGIEEGEMGMQEYLDARQAKADAAQFTTALEIRDAIRALPVDALPTVPKG